MDIKMKTKNALDIVVGSLVCGIVNENFSNCDCCPVRKKCDNHVFENEGRNPLTKESVHKAVTILWNEKVFQELKPMLVYK